MRLANKSLEELEDLEEELNEMEEELGFANHYQRIELYEEMQKKLLKLVREQNDEFSKTSLEYVTRKLIFNLIQYGAYLKMEYQKDDYAAIHCLEKALKYDAGNPIAAYRLGFLSYKYNDYVKALKYFQIALENQQYYKQTQYHLNTQQQVNAHLYLTNSALYIATDTYEQMNKLPNRNNEEVPNQDFSPLFRSLMENEKYLRQNGFYKINKTGISTCSKQECGTFISNPPFNTIILYFNDRNIVVVYEDEEVQLTFDQANMLRYFLLNSHEDSPTTRIAFSIVENIKPNTYMQSVNRLRNKLTAKGFPAFLHQTKFHNETAYYFDGSVLFTILYRVDDEIE